MLLILEEGLPGEARVGRRVGVGKKGWVQLAELAELAERKRGDSIDDILLYIFFFFFLNKPYPSPSFLHRAPDQLIKLRV